MYLKIIGFVIIGEKRWECIFISKLLYRCEHTLHRGEGVITWERGWWSARSTLNSEATGQERSCV